MSIDRIRAEALQSIADTNQRHQRALSDRLEAAVSFAVQAPVRSAAVRPVGTYLGFPIYIDPTMPPEAVRIMLERLTSA